MDGGDANDLVEAKLVRSPANAHLATVVEPTRVAQ